MIQFRYSGNAWKGTLAQFTASTRKWKLGDMIFPTDSDEMRVGNGVDVFADLISIPAGATPKSAKILPIGAPAAYTAIGATFADLPAARTAVNTLRTETLAANTATNAKIDALIAALTAGNLMLP